MLRRIADLADAHPWRMLAAAGAFVLAAAVVGVPVAGRLGTGGASFGNPDAPSQRASARLMGVTGVEPSPGLIAVVRPGQDVRRPPARALVRRLADSIARDPAIARVQTFEHGGGPALISRSGRETYIAAWFRLHLARSEDDAARALARSLERHPGVTVGGATVAGYQLPEETKRDLGRAELIAFPLLVVLSLWVFRGVVAALLPPLVGLVTVLGTFLALRGIDELRPLSLFALNLVTGLGLGLAIDYSLFVVSRYREELARAGPGREALRRTLATAGRTVLFSALTVAAAMASLLVFPLRFLSSMGIGGALVALLSAATVLLVLPPLFALLGTRVNALAPARWQRASERSAVPSSSGMWFRLAHAVMRRPGRVALLTALVLVALGLPFTGIRFTGIDPSALPRSASSRQVADTLRRDFPAAAYSPVTLALVAPRSARPQVSDYAGRLRTLPGAVTVRSPRFLRRDTWRLDVIPRYAALDSRSLDLVRAIRHRAAPFPVLVGGRSAGLVDTKRDLATHLPLALVVLAGATLVFLFAMTASLILPVKALVMNLLTISATFGVLVLTFQHGRLHWLLGYSGHPALEATQPVLLFAIAFGLSTDYGVFLLGRIKEAHDSGVANRDAVALGVERTGRVVTAAALLFCAAVGAFATSRVIYIKEISVGTALAVLIDSTIVRALLVPSLMALLGRWNWWAPAPLRRLHERLSRPARSPSAAASAGRRPA